MNLLSHFKIYDILWALERVLEVDSIFFNRALNRYYLYCSLVLFVTRLLLRYQEERDRERRWLRGQLFTQVIEYDSDEDVPDLVDNTEG